MIALDCDLAQHAEIGNGEHRNLRIDHACRSVPGPLVQIALFKRGYHVSPGKVRCIDCSSLRRWPRCSLCRPLRPPCCIQSFLGKFNVASPTTSDTVASHCACSAEGSTAMPLSIKARSLSSASNISPV